MGKADNRRSAKMLRLKAQRKLKARIKKRGEEVRAERKTGKKSGSSGTSGAGSSTIRRAQDK